MRQQKGRDAVRAANLTSDYAVLGATFFGFFLMTSAYFIISYFAGIDSSTGQDYVELLLGLFVALFFGGLVFMLILGVGMFWNRMMRQAMLGNALQIEYSDFAWLRDWSNHVAADLDMPRVEMFVTQDPYINAYAFGFIKPYCIVLHSGSIRYLSPEELKVVVVHEMAHIKYWHTNAAVYLQPFLAIPIVGTFAAWFIGFWNRRCELTADRLALMYMEDPELVKNSLIKVHVGPDVAKDMNEVARQWLQHTAERPMNHFAQTFSSHPFLVRRLSHIDKWASTIRPARAQAEQSDEK